MEWRGICRLRHTLNMLLNKFKNPLENTLNCTTQKCTFMMNAKKTEENNFCKRKAITVESTGGL